MPKKSGSSQSIRHLASDFEGSVDSAVESTVGRLNFTRVSSSKVEGGDGDEAPSFAAGRVAGRGDMQRRSLGSPDEQESQSVSPSDQGEGGSTGGGPARKVIVCNAYPSLDKLCVWRQGSPISHKLPYKECQELLLDASKPGDDLECRVGPAPCYNSLEDETESQRLTLVSSPVLADGVQDTTTILVVSRKSASERSLAFSSHIFGDAGDSAQVVLVDTFLSNGKTPKGQVYVADRRNDMRFEKLDYDRDTFVHSGEYSLELSSLSETLINKNDRYEKQLQVNQRLEARAGSHYVAIRIGSDDAISGERYPQDLLVFPKDWEDEDEMDLRKDLSKRLLKPEHSSSLRRHLGPWALASALIYIVLSALY